MADRPLPIAVRGEQTSVDCPMFDRVDYSALTGPAPLNKLFLALPLAGSETSNCTTAVCVKLENIAALTLCVDLCADPPAARHHYVQRPKG